MHSEDRLELRLAIPGRVRNRLESGLGVRRGFLRGIVRLPARVEEFAARAVGQKFLFLDCVSECSGMLRA